MIFFKGKVINRSTIDLLVVETTTNHGKLGKPPATVHTLGAGLKTPKNIDADGFKRADNKPINGHLDWWKIRSFSRADVYDDGSDLRVHVIWKKAVKDNEFGAYELDKSLNWGEPIKDVVSIIKNKLNQTTGYILNDGSTLSLTEAVGLAEGGDLDNVYVFKSKNGIKYLRTLPDSNPLNNLRV
jgi:hypothetical protein